MRSLALALALALAPPAVAADHEVSLEIGNHAARDPGFDFFSRRDVLPWFGARVGYAVHDRIAVVGSYHRARRGRDLFSPTSSGDARTALLVNEIALGAKADVDVLPWFVPYVTATGLVAVHNARFDDDPDDNEPIGQLAEVTTAGGARATLGTELRIPKEEAPFTVAVYAEGGWTLLSTVAFCPYGDMQLGGFTLRTGLGVRF